MYIEVFAVYDERILKIDIFFSYILQVVLIFFCYNYEKQQKNCED